MRSSYLLVVLVCSGLTRLFGQVYNGNIYLFSQQQVDSFPIKYGSVSFINGDLYIGPTDTSTYTDIAHLVPLAGLQKVFKNVIIQRNAPLTNLEGLNQMDTIGQLLDIVDNPNLQSLHGLENLKTNYFGDLIIEKNPSLSTLEGLHGYLSNPNGSIIIKHNSGLLSLNGLRNAKYIYYALRIVDNDRLKSVSGLDSLRRIWYLQVEENDSLLHFGNFPAVKSIDIGLYVKNNKALLDFSEWTTPLNLSQNDLTSVKLSGNDKLNSLTGLGALKHCFEVELLEDSLKSLSTTNNFPENIWRLYIEGKSLQDCKLRGLRNVKSELTVTKCPSLKYMVGSFPDLDTIGHTLQISHCDSLEVIDFDGLRWFGPTTPIISQPSFWIKDNPTLRAISGFNRLVRIGGILSVGFRDTISNLPRYICGFNNLEILINDMAFGYPFYWAENLPKIDSIHGFSKILTTDGPIGFICKTREFIAFNNLHRCNSINFSALVLDYMNGFSKLDTIFGSSYSLGLRVHTDAYVSPESFSKLRYNGSGLTPSYPFAPSKPIFAPLLDVTKYRMISVDTTYFESLNHSFPSLHTVGGLDFQNNNNLKTLDGLEGLQKVTGDININSNDQLADCSALCFILNNANITGQVDIHDNPIPCGEISDINFWCDTSNILPTHTTPLAHTATVRAYPNPNPDQVLNIQLSGFWSLPVAFNLVAVGGQTVASGNLTEMLSEISVSGISSGVYFLSLFNHENYTWQFEKLVFY